MNGVELSWMAFLGEASRLWADGWFIGLSVFVGYLVLGASGFGSALVIVPILSMQWPLSEVVPLVLLLDIGATLFSTGLHIRGIDRRLAVALIPFIVLGAWLGTQMGNMVDGQMMLGLLGFYIIWVGLGGLIGRDPAKGMVRLLPTPVAGASFGIIEILFGVVGPIAMIWLSARLKDFGQLRATLPAVILTTSAIAVGIGVSADHFELRPLITWAFALIPAVVAGVWAGHRIANVLSAQALAKGAYLLLSLSGTSVLMHLLQ